MGDEHPGSAHLDHDLLHHALLLLGRVLVGSRPTGKFCCFPECFTFCKVVQLYNCAVDIEGISLPLIPQLDDTLLDLRQLIGLEIVDDLEPQAFEPVQAVTVCGELHPLHILDIEQDDVQPPGCRHLGI